MSSFERRLATAVAFEEKVVAALVERGWQAERFGQGQLSEEMRKLLRRVETAVRWMPDIIAAQQFTVKTRLVFIDAKAGEKWRETGNHDVEAAALVGAELWRDYSGCETFFVFTDGGVIDPATYRELAQPGRFAGSGSGTPFYLAPRAACQRFDGVFGIRDAWMEDSAAEKSA